MTAARRFAAVGIGIVVAAAACSAPTPEPPLPEQVTTSTPTAVIPTEAGEAAGAPGEGASASDAPLQAQLDAVAGEVAAEFGGRLGISVAGETGAVGAGDAEATPAWSTIKVPIAIAALRAYPALYPTAASAITVSDNAAVEELYWAVGPGPVNRVLAEAGLEVSLNTEVVRPEFSTFGQTLLTPAQEAQLAGTIACLDGAGDVLGLMGSVDSGQAWGLGVLPGSMFKGGWGPESDGAYQVRQLGLMPLPGAPFAAVSLSAFPADGSFYTGQQMLTTAAMRLAQLDELPPAVCQP